MKTIEYNLVYPKSADNRLLLGRKQRGFGKNKWMGYGGKMEIGETIKESAQRELYEESKLFVELSDLNYLGTISNYRQNINHLIHIFTTFKIVGEAAETDEMIPKWFDFNDLPFDEMVDDRQYWFHLMINERKFNANIWYDDSNNLTRILIHLNQPITKISNFRNNDNKKTR